MKPLVHQTELFVDRLCERISSGERAPGIPVRLWRRGGGTNALPQRIPMKLTVRNLIIVIVDQAFFEARNNWEAYVRAAVEECDDKNDLVIPISVHADAARVSSAFGDKDGLPA